jgi:Flp pilus assembly protein TadD
MGRGTLALVLAVGACAPRAVAPVSLTSATLEAEARNEDAAQLALHRRDPAQALAMADRALRSRPDLPWAHYERAMALIELDRTDEARVELTRAEELYGDDHPHGKELALYGRALAFRRAGRCSDARIAFGTYAAFVRRFDPVAADRALAYADDCLDATPAVPDLTTGNAALMSGDHARALSIAIEKERAAKAPRERAWIAELRARALVGLGRNTEAAAAFERAAQEFETAEDALGRGRALYGEALALRAGARCEDAARAFERYAAFARPRDSADASRAEAYARDCPGIAGVTASRGARAP